MGVTIHYSGKLQKKEEIALLKDDLIDIAEIMDWEWTEIDGDWDKPNTARIEKTDSGLNITGHLPLKGVAVNLHPSCETLTFYFDNEGKLTTSFGMALVNEGKLMPDEIYIGVKTQFAPPEVHISIIKLLDFIKKRYVPDLEVFDEGGYWDRRDKTELVNRIEYINRGLDVLESTLSSLNDKNLAGYSAEELAKIIEDKLRGKSESD